MNFLDLPEDILEKVLENLTYDEVDKLQLVSEGTNKICTQVIKRGIRKAIRIHSLVSERVDDQLAHGYHDFIGHSIILMNIKTELQGLSFLYSGNRNLNPLCCNQGSRLDEILKILVLVLEAREKLNAWDIIKDLMQLRKKFIEELNKSLIGEQSLRNRNH